jgi:hypothetical protein
MRKVKLVALLDAAFGPRQRKQKSEFRRHIDVYFELCQIGQPAAPSTGSEG